ncbi:MAG: hypothetical protein H0T68_12200 [Gemmatimonadales bacterium]|nr:hypothetical protein [Gemmatimonadales bacterium]
MTERPRDWNKELTDIDRAIEKQGSGVAGEGGSTGEASLAPARAPGAPGTAPAARKSVALTWFWTLLAVALAVALPIWPYQRSCGLQLGFFLGAAAITILAGFLGALASWANRRALAHVLSLVVLAWATVMAAGAVLPRIGYARESQTWLCTEPAPQAIPPAVLPRGP